MCYPLFVPLFFSFFASFPYFFYLLLLFLFFLGNHCQFFIRKEAEVTNEDYDYDDDDDVVDIDGGNKLLYYV